jgi:hypothetical protein
MTSENSQMTGPKPSVFVLMPFDPVFDDIYQFGTKGAADYVGADVIVADMTGRNPNVFFEVGYAHALNSGFQDFKQPFQGNLGS